MNRHIPILLTALMAFAAGAAGFDSGERLPDLSIDDRGELVAEAGDFDYRPWHYPQRPGKVHVLQYLAATKSASELNDPFMARLKADFPPGTLLSTTILNLDDALWGTSGFVTGELKSNKKQFPLAILVADEEGVGRQRWQLESDSAAIIVTDREGTVLFFKEGAMSTAEIENALNLIRQQLAVESS